MTLSLNHLRTTERSLRILRGICKPKLPKAVQTKAFSLYMGPRPSKTFIVKRGPAFGPSSIKLTQAQIAKPLSTIETKPNGPPSILNPKKPPPTTLKKLVPKPIVPLTAPRFAKSTAGTTSVPSVTRVLSDTMPAASQFILQKWKESMIKKLGVEGFNKYQADTFERGRALHAVLAKYLLGQGSPTVELSQEIVSNLWKSIENVVNEKISNVRLVEHTVTHPEMNYRGIIDCVAFYEDELVVIDFKTAEKPKKTVESLYDNPIQVTAYCGAINNDMTIPLDVIDRNISSGLVIVAYSDGSKASVYYLNSEQVANNYWKKWINRLDQYKQVESMREQSKQEPVVVATKKTSTKAK